MPRRGPLTPIYDPPKRMPVDTVDALGGGGGGGGSSRQIIAVELTSRGQYVVAGSSVGTSIRMAEPGSLVDVQLHRRRSWTGSAFTVQVRRNAVAVLSTLASIDSGELSSFTAAAPPVISSPAFVAGDLVTFDIVALGTTSPASAFDEVVATLVFDPPA